MIRDLTNLNNHFTVEYASTVVNERKIIKKGVKQDTIILQYEFIFNTSNE